MDLLFIYFYQAIKKSLLPYMACAVMKCSAILNREVFGKRENEIEGSGGWGIAERQHAEREKKHYGLKFLGIKACS